MWFAEKGGIFEKLQETAVKENAKAWIEARPDILDKEIAMRKMELVANSLVLFCYHDLYIASIDWDCCFNIHAFDICSGHILRDANVNFVLVQKLGN